MSTSGFAGAASDIGTAVGDLFGAQGARASGTAYQQASDIAEENAQLTQQSTAIQEAQLQRQIYQTIGTQEADEAGAGMSASGSALDLLRDSQYQGNLAKAQAQIQGTITEGAYKEQAGLYAGLAAMSSSSAEGQTIGGVLSGVTGLVSLGSSAVSGIGALVGGSTAAAGTAAAETAAAGTVGAGALAGAADGGVAAAAGAADAAAAGGSGILGTIGTAIASVVSWVVCTELHRQGRLPTRWYAGGARRFAQYDERILRGYYVWAVPATRHLRAHPDSLLSQFLAWWFNHRLEFIAAQSGIRDARKTAMGRFALTATYALCWLLSRTIARRPVDWTVLQRGV